MNSSILSVKNRILRQEKNYWKVYLLHVIAIGSLFK